ERQDDDHDIVLQPRHVRPQMLEGAGVQGGLNQQDRGHQRHVAEVGGLPQAEEDKEVKGDHEQQDAVIHRVDLNGGTVVNVKFPLLPERGGKLQHALGADLEVEAVLGVGFQVQGEQEQRM